MYDSMMTAEVGDDVMRDDPTVNRLEELAAEILGKEAALYVVSGTMGNLASVLSHTSRGDEVILGADSHVYNMEVGGLSALGSVVARSLPFSNSIPDPSMIESAIRPENIHCAPAGLICLENALANGRVVSPGVMADVYALGSKHNIPVHVDGARIFNASVALGVDVKELTRNCDSISCCLSKGLCAPIGAVVAGKSDFIDNARRYRKMLGGGMRQCGVTAASGIVALTEMVGRLSEDHDNAKYLANKFSAMPHISVDIDSVEINMVFIRIDKPAEWKARIADRMLKEGIKIYPERGGALFRFLTHKDITRADIDFFAEKFGQAIAD
jgi:threonine aldolase